MSRPKLRYNISDWSQLPNCQSNSSNDLRIRVRKIMYGDILNGTLIEVYHEELGVLFSYVLEATGNMLCPKIPYRQDMSVDDILSELSKFGFLITFEKRKNLPLEQITYLRTLKDLGFDKLRVLSVYSAEWNGDVKQHHPKIVAFNVDKNPNWLQNTFVASQSEFLGALDEGSAINISAISETKQFSWNWLDYVASIDDILRDND